MISTVTFSASEVITYLQSAGWTEERRDERRSIWSHSSGHRVFVPGRAGPDTHDLLALALREIAAAEQRNLEDVSVDLAWPEYDRLRVRKASPNTSVTIAEAIGLHEAVNDIILAGARAVEDRRRSFAGRRPAIVDEYLDQVRILPSVPGSFVVRALLPLRRPNLPQTPLPLFGPDAAAVHIVSKTIMSSSDVAVQTAREIAQGAPPGEWENVISEGVSANLCDALSRLPGDVEDESRDVEVSIGWTWAEPYDATSLVTIPAGLAPVLAAGSDLLRGVPEEYEIRLTGLVIKLHREAAGGPGEITVKGHIEGFDSGARSLRTELDEQSYHQAVQAHDTGKSVRMSARVTRGQRGFDVRNVTGFFVVE